MLKLRKKAKQNLGVILGMFVLVVAFAYVSNEDYKEQRKEEAICWGMVELGVYPEETCK